MSPDSIRVEPVRIADLPEFARRAHAEAQPGDVVPISEHRAVAHSRNPHANADDVGLLVAYQGDRRVGYLGLMPARLQTGEGEAPVFWMSTWLVSPELRGQRVGGRLLDAALAMHVELAGTAYTRSAGRAMRAAGFQPLGPLGYHRVDLRRFTPWTRPLISVARKLRRAGHGSGRAAGVLRKLDRLGGWPVKSAVFQLSGANTASGGRRIHPVRIEPVERVGPAELPEPAAAVGATPRFVRGPEIVDWMLRYPWVREASELHDAQGYHFSDTRPLFRRFALRIRAATTDEVIGFAVLSVSNAGERTELRVLDHAFHDATAPDGIVAVALRYAAEHDADSLVFPAEFGAALRRNAWTRPFLRPRTRGYLIHPSGPDSPLARAAAAIRLDYADADTAFT